MPVQQRYRIPPPSPSQREAIEGLLVEMDKVNRAWGWWALAIAVAIIGGFWWLL